MVKEKEKRGKRKLGYGYPEQMQYPLDDYFKQCLMFVWHDDW